MSVPLTAPYRLEQPIVVQGMTHKHHLYCDVVPSGDPTGFNMVDRAGSGLIGVSGAIDAYLTLIAPCYYPPDTAYGTTVLQQFSGGAWLPTVSYTTAVVPTGAGTTHRATQLTLSMRDSAFHKVRQLFLESTVVPGLKTNNTIGFGAPWTAVAQGFTQTQLVASNLPWLWCRSRGNLFIGSFVSMVTDLNDKLRRARGIA